MVKRWRLWPKKQPANAQLLVRYYLGIILGLALIGLVLDFIAFGVHDEPAPEKNFHTVFLLAKQLTENHLKNSAQQRTQTLADPTQQAAQTNTLNVGNQQISILPAEAVQLPTSNFEHAPFQVAANSHQQQFMYWFSEDGQHLIRFGPIPQPAPIRRANWIPWVFYGGLFVLISAWLLPLLRDLDRISRAVSQFSNNYRAALPQLKKSSSLKPLASDIDAMAQRIRHLIDLQKDLSNVLSHEMRTPLSRVKFSLALLRDTHLTTEQSQELEGVANDVLELERLITAMLEFAKLDHPDMAIERQWLETGPWLMAITEKMARHSAQIDIQLDPNPSTHSQLLFADPYWLELAVSNLINNALRFARRTIQVDVVVDKNRFSLCVCDDGPGIDRLEQNRVIKPFYQSPTAVNASSQSPDKQKSRGGFGLGLALVKRIAQLHGGDLTIGTAELGGAKVTVWGTWPQTDRQNPDW